ncbi:hypothetical protein PR202_gb24750 [Eleusine coracana subsp. coracana]|uniref:Phosphatidylinositol N-acetylglucosaminyltransferase subunit H conserved domain-containing protein n=1 Tax=Eleusine coracana subsp. coracana TaxID=191504 RepID=A0AAV5FJI8_ELECO|nr:hypothetical protein PR202_gb24750 [Eleusine coracana subsp. coracana]
MLCSIVSGFTETMEHEQEAETSSGMYTYKHHCKTGLHIHEIFVRKSRSRVVLSYIGIFFLLTTVCQSLLAKDLSLGSVWNILFAVLVAKCLQYKPVKKGESYTSQTISSDHAIFWGSARDTFLEIKHLIVILSGRVDRHFVPIGKILKPLLNECVTPVTCYWSLVLVLRDEEELLLVFQQSNIEFNLQKFRPPLKMLVPVWKSLCTFIKF